MRLLATQSIEKGFMSLKKAVRIWIVFEVHSLV